MREKLFSLLKILSPSSALPPLTEYEIPVRPRKVVNVEGSRTTTKKVVNGKVHTEVIEQDGTISTEIGTRRPNVSNEVSIDRFDEPLLDFVVGLKWRKDAERAVVIKFHWLQGLSAAQIEKEHTDKKTNALERGFSERTISEYITALYDADDEREKHKVPRLRPPRNSPDDKSNVVEW